MASDDSVTIYYDPDRDGDIKARIKAVGEARLGPYAGRISESEWGRRLLLEILAQLEAASSGQSAGPQRTKKRHAQRRAS